jgi:hypothetical protein
MYHGFFKNFFDKTNFEIKDIFFFFREILDIKNKKIQMDISIYVLIELFFLYHFYFFFDPFERYFLFLCLKKEKQILLFFFNRTFWFNHFFIFKNNQKFYGIYEDSFESFHKFFLELDLFVNYD